MRAGGGVGGEISIMGAIGEPLRQIRIVMKKLASAT